MVKRDDSKKDNTSNSNKRDGDKKDNVSNSNKKDDSKKNTSNSNKRDGSIRRDKRRRDDVDSTDDEEIIAPPIKIVFIPPPKDDDGMSGIGMNSFKGKSAKLRDQVLKSNLDKKVKEEVLQRLKNLNTDKAKHMEWIENLLRIPFKEYTPLPVRITDSSEKIREYFKESQKALDEAVYGMSNVKEEIMNYIAQFISTDGIGSPRIIGLVGSPGVGKTQICSKGLAKALQRPFQSISMGGVKDSSYFTGFDFCYEGSRYGLIVQTLIQLQKNDAILFFDELDKISTCSSHGKEVSDLLVHITDPNQNNKFQDKYYSGIDIDLSKMIFVFSFNDEKLINPILLDRIHVIKVNDPSEKEKIIIGQKYLLKDICDNIGFNYNDIILPDNSMKYIIQKFCNNDKGVRGIKKCIQTIMLKINSARLLKDLCKYKKLIKALELCLVPNSIMFNKKLTITTEIIDELIQKEYDIRDEMIQHMFL